MPDADVYFLPQYARVYERKGDGKAHCFAYHSKDGMILYPFLLRRINDLGEFADSEACWDIATPYGYGGPLWQLAGEGSVESLGAGFLKAFHAYCIEHRIVSEFVRLHPLLENGRILAKANITRRHQTVCLDLDMPESEIWRGIRKGHKSSIKKGLQLQVRVIRDEDLEHVEQFFNLYNDTMKRRGAAPGYFFPLSFFTDTLTMLSQHASLFVALHGERIATAAIFLHYDKYIHYHFSGSDASLGHLCANHVLIHDVAMWARERGASLFHLGGGLQPDDGLYLFKSGFSNKRATFCTYECIHDRAQYEQLVSKLESHTEHMGEDPSDLKEDGFFPQYRAVGTATRPDASTM